jgi:hypothetical protein
MPGQLQVQQCALLLAKCWCVQTAGSDHAPEKVAILPMQISYISYTALEHAYHTLPWNGQDDN